MSTKSVNNNYRKQLERHNFIVTYIKKYIHTNLDNQKKLFIKISKQILKQYQLFINNY